MKSNDFNNLNRALDMPVAITRPIKTSAETNAILMRWPNLLEPHQVISHAASLLHVSGVDMGQGTPMQTSSVTVKMDSN